jgi:hypothetical protein
MVFPGYKAAQNNKEVIPHYYKKQNGSWTTTEMQLVRSSIRIFDFGCLTESHRGK